MNLADDYGVRKLYLEHLEDVSIRQRLLCRWGGRSLLAKTTSLADNQAHRYEGHQ